MTEKATKVHPHPKPRTSTNTEVHPSPQPHSHPIKVTRLRISGPTNETVPRVEVCGFEDGVKKPKHLVSTTSNNCRDLNAFKKEVEKQFASCEAGEFTKEMALAIKVSFASS